MTSANSARVSVPTFHASSSREVEGRPGRMFAGLRAWWSLYRTQRILSGLDERTLKDIGVSRPGGAAAAVDANVRRYLETLR